MATIMAENSIDVRQHALQQRVLLLAPSFGFWRGQYQLPRSKVQIAVDGADVNKNDVTIPCSKLMTDKYPLDRAGVAWKKRLQNLASEQAALIEKYSVPFPIRGVRMVPKKAGSNFLDELADIQTQLRDAVDEFIADLDRIMADIKRNTDPTVWEAVSRKIPNRPDQMRAKFYIDVVPVELAGGGDANTVTRDDLVTHSALVREATHRKINEAIEEMIAGPRQQLADALASLQSLIARDGRVTAKSFGPVRDAIAKIRLFDCVADAQLLTQIRQLEERIDRTTPTELTSVTAASTGFTAAINSVIAEVDDAVRTSELIERFGAEPRAIDFL